MFDKLGMTDEMRVILRLAEEEARGFRHEYVGTEHLLLGLMREDSGIAATVLRSHGIDLARVRHEIEQLVQYGQQEVTQKELPLTPRARQALDIAAQSAHAVNQTLFNTEHLLLGLGRETEGVAGQVLRNLGFDLARLSAEVLKIRLLQMKVVERVVRPVLANIVRKRRMRNEMLAHLSAIYDEELARSGDATKAVNTAAERFGDPTELSTELQATVPKLEQCEMRLDRTFGWRPPETAMKWMLRLSLQLSCVMGIACLTAGVFALREFGWTMNILLVVRPLAAMTIVLPLSFLVSGVCYYQMRNSLVGVFGIRKSTGRALLWAAMLAIATTAAGIGFLWMAYGGLPNPASDFWILAVFGVVWAGFALLHARANGPQEIRDTTWALLDLNEKPLVS